MYPRLVEEENDVEAKLLSDAEFLRVLEDRGDIFLIDSGNRVVTFEALALVIGVVFGIVLCTIPLGKAAPPVYHNTQREQAARLWRGPNPTLTKESEPGKEIEAAKHAGARPKTVSIAKYSKSPARNGALLPPEKQTGTQTPVEIKASEGDSLTYQRTEAMTKDETSLINLGNANKIVGDRAKAFSAFRQVLRQDPNNSTALAGMGELFLYTGLLDSAIGFYESALQVNPRIAAVHNGLGSARYFISTMAANPRYAARMKIPDPKRYIQVQYDSAIAEYTNAISLDSSYVDALTNRGVLRDIRNDFEGAIKDYTLAIKINPLWADAYAKRDATYKNLGKFKDAIADYTKAIKLDSTSYIYDPTLHFANAYFGRGIVYYKMGDLDKAIMDFDSTLFLSGNHSLAALNKAIALGDARRYDSAIVWYTKAIEWLSPMEYDGAQEHAYFGRGLLYSQTGRIDSALKDFNEAIRQRPDDHYARLHRGNVLRSQGKYDEAIADYQNASVFPPIAAKSCWRIAECYSLKQDNVDALAWLKRAIDNGFNDFAAWKRDKSLSILWNLKDFRDLIKQP